MQVAGTSHRRTKGSMVRLGPAHFPHRLPEIQPPNQFLVENDPLWCYDGTTKVLITMEMQNSQVGAVRKLSPHRFRGSSDVLSTGLLWPIKLSRPGSFSMVRLPVPKCQERGEEWNIGGEVLRPPVHHERAVLRQTIHPCTVGA